ncbi:hypothetical protein BVY02_01735 [bacterium J17]|nr:hypothetical protein BVY02_01735 [bacterium J17]
MEFIGAAQNLPFGFALGLMLAMAFLEGAGALIGLGLSSLIDSAIPEFDLDIDLDAPDVDSTSGLTKLLGWLRVDKVPVLVLFVVFLTSFGIVGYCIQLLSLSLFGLLMPAIIASTVSFTISLPVLRFTSGVIATLMPKDETAAVSESSFIGRTAIVTLGVAQVGKPVQARLQDEFGKSHYVMVEPDTLGEEFSEGAEVLLVKREGSVFKVINDTTNTLVN